MFKIGDSVLKNFKYSQEDVINFAKISGDMNPIHLDKEYSKNTIFKKPIIHGFLGGSIFSKILSESFWGEGTIYLSQNLIFKRPMFVEIEYLAKLTIIEINESKNISKFETIIFEENNKIVINGEAIIKYPKKNEIT